MGSLPSSVVSIKQLIVVSPRMKILGFMCFILTMTNTFCRSQFKLVKNIAKQVEILNKKVDGVLNKIEEVDMKVDKNTQQNSEIKSTIEEIKQIIEGTVNITIGEVVISENGTALLQEHSYDHTTKEAVVKVPAHKGYGNNTFIMIGRNSNHPLAGKMMSVFEDRCYLFDKPDEMDSRSGFKKRSTEASSIRKQL